MGRTVGRILGLDVGDRRVGVAVSDEGFITALALAPAQGIHAGAERTHDDGRGGASPGEGTGLRGLEQRAAAVDGTLSIDSPPGGPTTITAELPCES